jgi:signal transduction histidine kinase
LVGDGGRPVPVQLSVSRALLADVEVFCVVVTDLTQQRRQEVYRAARLEIEARDRLFSVAAHELRNPLSVVELLRKRLVTSLERVREGAPSAIEAAIAIANKLGKQGVRLEELVGKLLDVGSIGAGRLPLDRRELDLAELVGTVMERLRDQLDRSRSHVTLDLHPVRGHWDRIRPEQVIENLISNAAKYGLGRPIPVFVDKGRYVARLGIEDQGPGIPGEARERIFRPYERVADTRGMPGLGIRLYVTAEIVKAHGGTIRVQGKPDGGSLFFVELPFGS